jgi:hypothetical protein
MPLEALKVCRRTRSEHPTRPARLPGVIELRRAAPFLAFALALLVAGCALLPGPFRTPEPDGSPFPMLPPATRTTDQATIESAAVSWAALGIDDYRLDLGFLCACALPPRVIVEVVDGVPTVTDGAGQPLDADKLAMTPVTLDQLFAEIRRAQEGGGVVQATFDPATGLPSRLDIDYLPQGIDDELSIVVNDYSTLVPEGPTATD